MNLSFRRQEHRIISWYCFDCCVVLLCVFTFWVPCCDVRYVFSIKPMLGTSLSPVVCRTAHVLFTLFVFVCAKWCPVHFVLCFCIDFLRLVYPILPVSLGYTFLIGPSIFSNVYLVIILSTIQVQTYKSPWIFIPQMFSASKLKWTQFCRNYN